MIMNMNKNQNKNNKRSLGSFIRPKGQAASHFGLKDILGNLNCCCMIGFVYFEFWKKDLLREDGFELKYFQLFVVIIIIMILRRTLFDELFVKEF